MNKQKVLLKAKDIAAMPEVVGRHPLNPLSEIHLKSLGDAIGLQRLGIHLARLTRGRESNIYHTHHFEEEFFYILSGRGVALIDGQKCPVAAGDFFAFTTPSVAHVLSNLHDEDLVYLVGGERKAFEIAEFPGVGKVLVREGMKVFMVDAEDFKELDWGRRWKRAQKSAGKVGRK